MNRYIVVSLSLSLSLSFSLIFLLQISAVAVSGITYQNIVGTSATPVAIKLDCSKTVWCNDIVLNDINLVVSGGKAAKSICSNVNLIKYGTVVPSDCGQWRGMFPNEEMNKLLSFHSLMQPLLTYFAGTIRVRACTLQISMPVSDVKNLFLIKCRLSVL